MIGDLVLSAVAVLLGLCAWNVPDNVVAKAVGLALAVLGVWLLVESVIDRGSRRRGTSGRSWRDPRR